MKHSRMTFVLALTLLFFVEASVVLGADANRLNFYSGAGLKKAMDPIIEKYQKAQKVQISPNYGPSGGLYAQIVKGQPCDLYFSADWKFIDKLQQEGRLFEKKKFLTDAIVVIVSKSGRTKIRSFEDLKKKDVVLVVADPRAPVGGYTIKGLSSLGLWDTLQANKTVKAMPSTVNQVAIMVQKDEADAGFIFKSVAAMYGLEFVQTMGPDPTGEIVFGLGVIKGGNEKNAAHFMQFIVEHADEFTKYGWQVYE
ncbi:MAG: molybdate ABC transporter substrate-binding protein [Desulfobacterales bacterium]|nr:molybdate ABC transporter substrate-binding protein [Desulfobacterales bacterium]